MPHHKTKISHLKKLVLSVISAVLIFIGLTALWIATLQIPDFSTFQNRKVVESTKIYDRTGTILLFNTGVNTKMTTVPITEISLFIQQGTIAIEDSNFYHNNGIEPTSIVRAIVADITTGNYSQGASTITQQVVKNSLLTKDKTVTRKIKEWVLAIKLTRTLSKDKILETYLNETPYGGTIYGVEEASQSFFGRPAKDVTLAQAAYLSAIPQAPTYFSPYGTHRDALTARQRLVLQRMKELGMITQADYDTATKEKVEFLSRDSSGIRAPHFVMFVRDLLVQKYGEEIVSSGGLRVITTLDYDMQQKAEDTVNRFAPSLAANFRASNTAMVAIDPKTGDILTMLGSKNYFDKEIDGNYNVALAQRQPGSTFKPFVYATLFKKGFTPDTVLFDTQTEFSQYCTPEGKPVNESATSETDPNKKCYMPQNYDGKFFGPMSIRSALAQSRNIPGIKALYLAGIQNSIKTARDMGITTLNDPNRYGLTLVLGGGEVTLLDMTSAYGVFANDGARNPYRAILRVEDNKGNILEDVPVAPQTQVLEPDIARQISSILSDKSVRMSSLNPIVDNIGRTIAIKTGTTNNYKDVWLLGYTPSLVVGTWIGNNNNTPLQHTTAALIISPMWGAYMTRIINKFPVEDFKAPLTPPTDTKPVIRGIWQGGNSFKIDTVSGKLATQYTPPETTKEVIYGGVHTILNWLNKSDPNGPAPANPKQDSQYENWEFGVRKWFDTWKLSNPDFKEENAVVIPTATDDVHVLGKAPSITIVSPKQGDIISGQDTLNLTLQTTGLYPPKKTVVYLNGKYVLTNENSPLNISFIPSDTGVLSSNNTLSITMYDSVYNQAKATVDFTYQQ